MARTKIAQFSPSTSCSSIIIRRPRSFGKQSKRAASSGSDASDSAKSSDEENNVTSPRNRKGIFKKKCV